MSTHRALATPLILAALLLAAGCGKEVPNPAPGVKAAQGILDKAVECEQGRSFDEAKRHYESARTRARELITRLVPGDELLLQARKIHDQAAAGAGRMARLMREQDARAAAAAATAAAGENTVPNLLPPVLAYKPPEPKPEPTPENPENPKDPKDPKDPKSTDPGTTPKPPDQEPPKEPEKPQPVKVTRVELKKDGKTVLIYWTFTNLTGGAVRLGAPMGYVLNRSGGKLTTFRQHFLAKDFRFNEDDPLASQGTAVTPDSVQLNAGGSRDIITVGTTTQGKQAGGGKIVVRMGDGTEPEGALVEIVKE